jgi:serine/threonine protein kinase
VSDDSDGPSVQSPATVTTRRSGYARLRDAEPVARVGDVLVDRFRLQRIMGRGGMGVVFAASDLHMQGEPSIAVKLLNEDMREFPVAAKALERECRKVRMMAHDAIVRVFEFYRSGDLTFITMELLDGESLDVIIRRFPQGIPWDDAWMIIRSAGDALAYAHRQTPPFVHSDFKPSNVFVTLRNQVKVLDFGVARAARSSEMLTAHNLSIFDPAAYGALTPAYASCEMLAGLNADPRDDVYALACVAYEILSGQHPFGRRPADQARAMRLTPAPISGLGARINRTLARGLAIDRADRTASVGQFLQELGDPPAAPEVRRQRRRRAAQVAAGILAVAALSFAVRHWVASPQHPSAQSVSAPVESTAAPQARIEQARIEQSQSAAAATTTSIPGERALALLQILGVAPNGLDAHGTYSESHLRQLIATSPRQVTLGSTPEQMRAAFALCRQYSSGCEASWYTDEKLRTVTLNPFELDSAPVTVRDFRRFVDATSYVTDAQTAGFGYAVVGESLRQVNGGSWLNAMKQYTVNEDSAVIGVTFRDAQNYCRFRKARLPTEDEWEYIARGPERSIFPWGDNVSLSPRARLTPPRASDGPDEGIGGRYRGLSGNVWQWVDTSASDGSRILKGGSWMETNPANRRSAVQRMEQPSRADADSGFRCARSSSQWTDVDLWLARLKS